MVKKEDLALRILRGVIPERGIPLGETVAIKRAKQRLRKMLKKSGVEYSTIHGKGIVIDSLAIVFEVVEGTWRATPISKEKVNFDSYTPPKLSSTSSRTGQKPLVVLDPKTAKLSNRQFAERLVQDQFFQLLKQGDPSSGEFIYWSVGRLRKRGYSPETAAEAVITRLAELELNPQTWVLLRERGYTLLGLGPFHDVQ